MIQFFIFLTCFLTVTFALFLPALIELNRPQDCGPRRIIGIRAYSIPLMNLEEDYKIDKILLSRLSLLFETIPNLEAFTS